jgi:hypothetical protein
MYVEPNFKTKKALKDAVQDDDVIVRVFQPGPFAGPNVVGDNVVTVEGPQSPEAHKWYARVQISDGYVTKVIQ